MNHKVTVIDYGVGNLMSVGRAIEYCGAEIAVTDDPRKIAEAERLILPGVGAFADGMAGLRERGLVDVIREYATSGRPFMGICLGMQMMMDQSEEFGLHEGLGLIPGHVSAIPDTTLQGAPHKIPHIGWNELCLPQGRENWDGGMMEGLPHPSTVYFVHSYAVIPQNSEHVLAVSYYNGRQVTAAIQSGAVCGCQFHPEKSGKAGLHILQKWLSQN